MLCLKTFFKAVNYKYLIDICISDLILVKANKLTVETRPNVLVISFSYTITTQIKYLKNGNHNQPAFMGLSTI